jgi:hypothetical protein
VNKYKFGDFKMNMKILMATAAISLFSGTLHAIPQDEVFMSAQSAITKLVEKKKVDACNQVEYMKKQSVTAPRFHENLNAWQQTCTRRTEFLKSLTKGSKVEALQTMKNIYRDPDVARIVDEAERKMAHKMVKDMDPLSGAL